MTSPNFAELKERLTKLDDVAANAYLTRYMEGGYVEPTYQEYGEYVHTKSAAIITELLEIIQGQSKEVESYSRYIYCAETCKLSTSWSDHAKCTCGAEKLKNSVKAALSETNTRLQKLINKGGII